MTLKNRGVCNVANVLLAEFQTDGPATENARSPNLVTVGGIVYDNVSALARLA